MRDASRGIAACRIALACAVLLALGAHAGHAAPPPASATERARLLHRFAESAIGDSSIENRQRAKRDLEEAIRLEPRNPDHFYLLGRLATQGELDSDAIASFRAALAIDPRHVDARMALAFAWKRQWMRTLDSLSIANAYAEFDTVTRLHPHGAAAWLQLVPLCFEGCDVRRAAVAAESALAGRPRFVEAGLAAAYTAYRSGAVTASDSLFRATIPRLTPDLRHWFDAPPLPGGGWQGLDPDPTTPENEFQLEYWSRVAHALLLFYDPDRPNYDARTETYIRYGPPDRAAASPPDIPGYFKSPGSSMAFPTPIIAWYYPGMGMRVVLQDRSLHGRFQPRALPTFDPTTVPDPRMIARRGDLAAFGGFVMPKLPPASVRLDVRGAVARFEGMGGPHVIAQVETPGAPAEPLSSRWVVTDTSGRVVARGAQPLAPAGCDPASVREMQLTADLAPGVYKVSVSIRDPQRWRALYETRVAIAPSPPGLAASDLVLVCGEPGSSLVGPALRFDLDVEARRKASRPLVAYFEIYHLAHGTDGAARFAFDYEVRRADADGRATGAALLSISREDVEAGRVRRQFLSVPLAALRPGRYVLLVRIRDAVADSEIETSAPFTRE